MLKVNEIFPAIQGEGKSAGREVVFIRLSMCPLHCDFCDTPYTWNWLGTKFKHPHKFEKAKEIHLMDNNVILNKVAEYKRKSIVISGGEPFLQQRNLLTLIGGLKKLDYWIEIETAGVIAPDSVLLALVDQINCSPKLSNSGNSVYEREKPFALKRLSECGKANFKLL